MTLIISQTMQKTLFFLLAGTVLAFAARAQKDSSPLNGKTLGDAARFAGGVDKEKIMDLFQDQQFDEAVAYLSPVLKADSDNVPVLNYTGYAYYMQNDEQAAIACYRRMLAVDSNSITALHYMVQLLQGANDAEALNDGLRLVQLQPTKPARWRTVGNLWRRNKQPDSALAYLSKAFELAPGDLKTIADLGSVLVEGKQYDKADSLVDLGLAKDSLNVPLLKLRVASGFWSKRYPDVLAPGEKLLRLNEPSVQSLEWLVLSYYNLKQYPDCIRVCEGMQGMAMDIEAVYYYESRAEAKLKHYAKSDTLLRIALTKAVSKTAEWYYDDLGDNYESTKDYRQSLAHYDTAYYLFKAPLILYNCGRICETELHNLARAKVYYRRYLAVAKPESEEEKRVYKLVKAQYGGK
jgi:tetratricopeptide (TPR) repeat protein